MSDVSRKVVPDKGSLNRERPVTKALKFPSCTRVFSSELEREYDEPFFSLELKYDEPFLSLELEYDAPFFSLEQEYDEPFFSLEQECDEPFHICFRLVLYILLALDQL